MLEGGFITCLELRKEIARGGAQPNNGGHHHIGDPSVDYANNQMLIIKYE